MQGTISINLNGKDLKIPKDLSLVDLMLNYNEKDFPVIGIKINNEIAQFDEEIKEDSKIEFLYVYDQDGNKIYKSALKYVLIVAIKELYNNKNEIYFEHSIDKGICFTITNNSVLGEEDIIKIKNIMQRIINSNERFIRLNVSKADAIEYYLQNNEREKAENINNIYDQVITLYKLKNNYNYFYTDMPYSTGCLKDYNIVYLGNNKFVLLFPIPNGNKEVPEYNHYPLNMQAFEEYKKWIKSINIENVADINYLVSHNKIEDFIHTNELYLQKNILKEAEKIYKRKNIKIVLIAGPSSSGKTTTSKKLSVALKTYGLKIFNISIDDYYINQTQMPKTVIKNKDFESIDLIDLDLFNDHLRRLLNKEKVVLPTYDFHTGIKEFNSDPVQIDENTIIIVEGIHALNNKLIRGIAEENKYKIYVSPFAPLSIDRHNHLSTLDLRLIRRIVRDNKFRAVNVEDTLKSWKMVRAGEEKYIFPYMNNVDSVLNTSLIYEIGILKVYAEPLLYSVSVKSKMYEEAKRLIEFLKIFYPIPSEYVEKNSLLREFIGGSIFK